MIDLTQYTILELENLIKLATNEIINRKSTDLISLRAKIDELIRMAGCTLEDILAVQTKPLQNIPHNHSKDSEITSHQNHEDDTSEKDQENILSELSQPSFITETVNVLPSDHKEAEKSKKMSIAAKYKDADSPENTWSGRGKMPKWLQIKIKDGANLEDFLITPLH